MKLNSRGADDSKESKGTGLYIFMNILLEVYKIINILNYGIKQEAKLKKVQLII